MKTEEDEKIIKIHLTLVSLYCKQYLILLELMTPEQKTDLKKTAKEVYTLLHEG